MKFFFPNRITVLASKFSYLETAIAILLYTFIGFWLSPNDPLLIEYYPFYLIILVTILVLFHGLSNALFSMFIVMMVFKRGYAQFPTRFFLELVILLLVLGLFHYIWEKKLRQNESILAFKEAKLDELSNAFYTLKISHDQIEKNYVFKPRSLRTNIIDIKKSFNKQGDHVSYFLKLLANSFFVTKAELFFVQKNKLYTTDDTNFTTEIKLKDLMLTKAIEGKKAVYVSSFENNQTDYIAAIPAVYNKEVKAVFLIKSMPFLSFNRDSMSNITVLLNYFMLETIKWQSIYDNISNNRQYRANPLAEIFANQSTLLQRQDLDTDFYYELSTLYNIKIDFDVSSTLLILNVSDKLLAHLLLDYAKRYLRALDLVTSHLIDDGIVMISLLFPFSEKSSAQGFLTRLLQMVKIKEEDPRLLFSMFDVYDIELAKEFAHLKTTDAVAEQINTPNLQCS